MDIRELIGTLNNVVDKDAAVIVRTDSRFVELQRVSIGSEGICLELDD